MSIIIPANSAVGGGFEVANSCRFDGSSSYLQKTYANSQNKTFSISTWVKRSELGDAGAIWSSYHNATNYLTLAFKDDDALRFQNVSAGVNMNFTTNRLFRDVSAWMHILAIVDTTDGTAGDRQQIFINGVRETSFSTSTAYALNAAAEIGATDKENIVGRHGTGDDYFDGYMAEHVFIDGLALEPDSFGEFDEDSGIFKPIDVSGLTFGTNGFYLDFENSGALGADVSGNTNNFTVNNLTAIDQSTDTCTNNFATLNPLDNFYNASTFSEGNLKLSTTTTPEAYNSSTIAVSSGKWYCEIEYDTTASGSSVIGIVDGPPTAANASLHKQAQGWGYRDGGNVKNNDSTVSGSWASYTTGDIIGIALDLDNNRLFFSKNGSFQNSGDPTSSTGAITITAPSSLTTGHYFFAIGDYNAGTSTFIANFGNPIITGTDQTDGNDRGSFEYAVPSGYLALCTKNLSGELS